MKGGGRITTEPMRMADSLCVPLWNQCMPGMEAEDHPFVVMVVRCLMKAPTLYNSQANRMQNNISPEEDTSQGSREAGEGCCGSESKMDPVTFLPSAFRWIREYRGEIEKEKEQGVGVTRPLRKIQLRRV